MSLSAVWFGPVNPLGETALIQAQPQFVASRCRQIGHTVMQLKDESSRHQSSDRDRRVATLQPPQGISAHKKTRCHVEGADAALTAREREIPSQLFKGALGWQRHRVNQRRHEFIVAYNRHYGN